MLVHKLLNKEVHEALDAREIKSRIRGRISSDSVPETDKEREMRAKVQIINDAASKLDTVIYKMKNEEKKMRTRFADQIKHEKADMEKALKGKIKDIKAAEKVDDISAEVEAAEENLRKMKEDLQKARQNVEERASEVKKASEDNLEATISELKDAEKIAIDAISESYRAEVAALRKAYDDSRR